MGLVWSFRIGRWAVFGVASVVALTIAVLMHLFGWGSGRVDVTLFALAGLLCLAVHLVTGWWPGRHGA